MALTRIDRDHFAQRQLIVTNYKLSWLEDGTDARKKFTQLAMDTYDASILLGENIVFPFDPWPESAFNGLTKGREEPARHAEADLANGLVQRWREWNDEYYILRSQSPKLELRDIMQEISESHDASSWPVGYERKIQDWVDAGDAFAPPPFDDRRNIATETLFRKLERLRNLLRGWMFWDDQICDVRFVAEPEWQLVRAEQERTEATYRREWAESKLRSERVAKRLPEILALARADDEFWSSLQEWERSREAKRPLNQRNLKFPRLEGPVRIFKTTPEEQKKHANSPMDTLWARFFERVHQPNDFITPQTLISILRAEVRRELGYDNFLGWAGGPGIGES